MPSLEERQSTLSHLSLSDSQTSHLSVGGKVVAPEAFEIDPGSFVTEDTGSQAFYSFTRNTRMSVSRQLKGFTDDGTRTQVIDPYTKAPDSSLVLFILVVGTKEDMWELAGACKDCGLVLGIIGIVAAGTIQTLLARRFLDVPQWIGQNLESYGDAARVCFYQPFSALCVITNTFVWLLSCNNAFSAILFKFPWYHRLLCATCAKHRESIVFLIASTLFLYLLSFGFIRLKDLRRSGKVCMYSAIAFLIISAPWCLYQAVAPSTVHEWIITKDGDKFRGMTTILLSFSGTSAILPYLTADVLSPQHAKKAVTKGFVRLTILFVLVGIFHYVAYGKNTQQNIMRTALFEHDALRHADVIKTAEPGWAMMWYNWYWPKNGLDLISLVGEPARFLIFFWALERELACGVARGLHAPMELNLPWAVSQYIRTRWIVRIMVFVLSTILLYLFIFSIRDDPSKSSGLKFLKPCVILTNIVFMPLMIWIAQYLFVQREREEARHADVTREGSSESAIVHSFSPCAGAAYLLLAMFGVYLSVMSIQREIWPLLQNGRYTLRRVRF